MGQDGEDRDEVFCHVWTLVETEEIERNTHVNKVEATKEEQGLPIKSQKPWRRT